MHFKFINKIVQDSIENWLWILPAISYVRFKEGVSGIYFSWLKWDIMTIEWYTIPDDN